MRILFLCTANRFRSQAAAAIGRKLGLSVESAGLYRGAFDKTIPKSLREALYVLGDYFVPEDERSKPVNQKMIEWADRIIYMNPVHYKQLLKRFPTHRRKFSPLGGYTEPPALRIPDPMFLKGAEYTKCMKLIESGVMNLAKVVKGK
jgi:protein arginine phosphatase